MWEKKEHKRWHCDKWGTNEQRRYRWIYLGWVCTTRCRRGLRTARECRLVTWSVADSWQWDWYASRRRLAAVVVAAAACVKMRQTTTATTTTLTMTTAGRKWPSSCRWRRRCRRTDAPGGTRPAAEAATWSADPVMAAAAAEDPACPCALRRCSSFVRLQRRCRWSTGNKPQILLVRV